LKFRIDSPDYPVIIPMPVGSKILNAEFLSMNRILAENLK